MYKVGIVPGRFLPPHRGHLNAILQASTKCEKLYVVVCENEGNKFQCEFAGIKPMSLEMRARWLSAELSELSHIKVLMLDERKLDIPEYPFGWEKWSKSLHDLIPEEADVIFGGEEEYKEGYTKYFPSVKYEIYDCKRTAYPISGTAIRNNPYANWDYILGAARPHFAKKVLIVGTESCGKTTLTKMLAKTFHTSWAREEGRYYSEKYFGCNEDVFNVDDFFNIGWEQRQIEEQAFRNANKIVFCDTDAVITQYYCEMYMGESNPKLEVFVDKDRYDLILMMKPDVKWVDDGLRWNSEDEKRWKLHEQLKQMYLDRGFDANKIVEIGGNYNERFNKAIELSNKLLGGK